MVSPDSDVVTKKGRLYPSSERGKLLFRQDAPNFAPLVNSNHISQGDSRENEQFKGKTVISAGPNDSSWPGFFA